MGVLNSKVEKNERQVEVRLCKYSLADTERGVITYKENRETFKGEIAKVSVVETKRMGYEFFEFNSDIEWRRINDPKSEGTTKRIEGVMRNIKMGQMLIDLTGGYNNQVCKFVRRNGLGMCKSYVRRVSEFEREYINTYSKKEGERKYVNKDLVEVLEEMKRLRVKISLKDEKFDLVEWEPEDDEKKTVNLYYADVDNRMVDIYEKNRVLLNICRNMKFGDSLLFYYREKYNEDIREGVNLVVGYFKKFGVFQSPYDRQGSFLFYFNVKQEVSHVRIDRMMKDINVKIKRVRETIEEEYEYEHDVNAHNDKKKKN